MVARAAAPGNSGVLTGNSSIGRAVVPGSSGLSKSGAARPVPLGPAEDEEPARKKSAPSRARTSKSRTCSSVPGASYRGNFGAMIGAAMVFFIVSVVIVLTTAGELQTMHAPVFVLGLGIQALTIWLTFGAPELRHEDRARPAAGRRRTVQAIAALWSGACHLGAVLQSDVGRAGHLLRARRGAGPASLLQFLGGTTIYWFLWMPAQLALIDGHTTAAKVPLDTLRYAGRNFSALAGSVPDRGARSAGEPAAAVCSVSRWRCHSWP